MCIRDRFTVRQLAELVIAMTGSASVITSLPLPADDPKVRQPDISRARAVLGWAPTVPLREGLAATIDYFRGLTGSARLQPPT